MIVSSSDSSFETSYLIQCLYTVGWSKHLIKITHGPSEIIGYKHMPHMLSYITDVSWPDLSFITQLRI